MSVENYQEGMKASSSNIEEMDNKELADYTERLFNEEVLRNPGLFKEWETILETENSQSPDFSKACYDYVRDADQLSESHPKMYHYLKERIFFDREFKENYEEILVKSCAESLSHYRELDKDRWERLSEYERAKILRDVTKSIAGKLDVPVENVIFEKMEPGLRGYYNQGDRIYLNNDILKDPEKIGQGLETLVHEMRHAYQLVQVKNMANSKEDITTLIEWKQNIDNYIDANYDRIGYYKQAIEKDAREFASTVLMEWRKNK
ncbi:MAG: hypothetical protein AB2421_02705 [Thermotaleaceae bacterium]